MAEFIVFFSAKIYFIIEQGGENMKGKIYKIYNDINNKLYIGKTLDTLENRFNEHKKDSTKQRNEKRPLYNAMNKYGVEHFHIELVEEVNLEDLSIREIYWIEYYNTYRNGYNATRGGDGKQLYDYDLIVDLYNQGLLIKEVAKEMNCDELVVRTALKLAGVDSSVNKIKNCSKGIRAYDKNHNLIAEFTSESEAARWLIDEGIALTDSVKNVVTAIGRVAKGQRKSAYKMYWEFVK